jgi:flagellar hook protein FlgE
MPSIVNGLFAARSGISTHGIAIGVVGDNISNSNTIGFKGSRADFSDLLSGGQQPGKVVGIGSQISNIVATQEQGTLEFTGRTLDLAVDGRGYFIIADGAQRFYSRAGNFKIDASGFIVNAKGQAVLGFPLGGSGALEPLNINSTSQQTGVETRRVDIAGNINASSPFTSGIPPGIILDGQAPPGVEPVTYSNLNSAAQFSTVVQVFDTLGASHNVSLFFYKTAAATWTVQAVTNSDDVDASGSASGFPRLLGSNTITFNSDGSKATPAAGTPDLVITPIWNNNSDVTIPININLTPFTQFAAGSNVLSLDQDGLGVGVATGVNIENNGSVFALLDNGQSTVIGTIAMATFANEEGLARIGNNLLQRTLDSGEPVVGNPESGSFGSIEAGSLELSTVDLAGEFVRLINLQRGFQANSRIISSINQLLGEIVQIV